MVSKNSVPKTLNEYFKQVYEEHWNTCKLKVCATCFRGSDDKIVSKKKGVPGGCSICVGKVCLWNDRVKYE